MKLNNLQDLFLDILKDLYNAENLILKALPKMVNAATSPDLKEALQDHLEETEEQIIRLEEVFSIIGTKPEGKRCRAMEGLIQEAEEVLALAGDTTVRDATIIAAAQKVEHYEIASYGTLRTFADVLGLEDAADLLEETLDEEKSADERLTEIAEAHINEEADKS